MPMVEGGRVIRFPSPLCFLHIRVEVTFMKMIGILMLLVASYSIAQNPGDFKPASSNVLDAQYPKVDGNSRVQIRFKAPDATKVKLNFWSGPKVDMEKQPEGFWTFTTTPSSWIARK